MFDYSYYVMNNNNQSANDMANHIDGLTLLYSFFR